MSSPRNIGNSVREGTRVVLREITASLHNSPPMQPSRRKSDNDNSAAKTAEHEVKVRFAREFADVGSITYSAPESLSSASSFQSLNSNLSTKSSSGICPDSSVPPSPNQTFNSSYVNSNISGVEDLIVACADIQLNSEEDRSSYEHSSQDLSQDQTFASATDEPLADLTKDDSSRFSLTDSQNVTQIIESSNEPTRRESSISPSYNRLHDIEERPILRTICIREPLPVAVVTTSKNNSSSSSILSAEESVNKSIFSLDKSSNDLSDGSNADCSVNGAEEEISLPHPSVENSNLNSTVCLSSPGKEIVADACKQEERVALENTSDEAFPLNVTSSALSSVTSASVSTEHEEHSLPSISTLAEHAEELSLPSLPTFSSLLTTSSSRLTENDSREGRDDVNSLLARSLSPINDPSVATAASPRDTPKSPVQEARDNSKSDSPVKTVSPGISDVANSGESYGNCLNDTPKPRTKTPEVQENSTTNTPKDIECDNIVVNKGESSPSKGDSLEISASPSRKEEVVEDKLNGSSDTKRIDSFEKIFDSINSIKGNEHEEKEEESSEEKLDTTLTLQDISLNSEIVPEVEQYAEFKPQRQSTALINLSIEQPNFDDLKSAAEQVANDIFKSSLEFSEENDRFVSATSDIFQDPTSFDFLIAHGNSKTINRLRTESLYVKFDPLVSDTSMLPQGNTPPINEEQNGKSDNAPTNIGTPKCNPALAAIDRLLYYSPISTRTVQKTEEPREKIEQPAEEPKLEAPLITDINMSKELELVKATVLELEEELQKQKKEYETELEKQKNSFQEKINKLQAQIAQEVKSKSQMTVVVEEYEKSISRLLTERERDRTNFEQEKAKLQEELQATNVHLTNTEAAFNDVHQKYERLKGVVSVYKNNEAVLKESIQENMETIKGLETRYDQLKNHAMAQLEKANFELDGIRKQHEDETVKLHAMVRKAELKSNSLAELVEQKTKENKELTQILDEVIARVGHQNAE